MTRLRAFLVQFLAVAIIALPACFAAIPNISGFVTQIDGDTVTAAEWNSWVGGVYTYLNNNIVSALNVVTTKGDLFVHNGSALARLGVGTNGQVLTADSAETTGLKWAGVASVTNLTTKGDLLGYDSGLARIPVGADNTILTADSTQAAGVRWATSATGVPTGVIALWSGSVASIPSGWALCDGQSGRPNLQGMFVIGAGNVSPAGSGGLGLLNPAVTGGAVTHVHTFSGSTSGPSGAALGDSTALTTFASNSHSHTFSGSTNLADHTPPYYALCYIIKT